MARLYFNGAPFFRARLKFQSQRKVPRESQQQKPRMTNQSNNFLLLKRSQKVMKIWRTMKTLMTMIMSFLTLKIIVNRKWQLRNKKIYYVNSVVLSNAFICFQRITLGCSCLWVTPSLIMLKVIRTRRPKATRVGATASF